MTTDFTAPAGTFQLRSFVGHRTCHSDSSTSLNMMDGAPFTLLLCHMWTVCTK